MNKFFSKYKAKYHQEKGQVFPFLIAVAVAIIIMIMITVNLGQVGVYKTETSNAADAGALAGASVISGTLLGLGMRSDYLLGYAMMMFIGMVLAIVWWAWYGVVVAVMIYLAYIIHAITQYEYAMGDSRLGWTSAKQTAMKYAFNNAGVDEPRKLTYNEFAQQTGGSYERYLKAEGTDRMLLMTGFSKFMSDTKTGKGVWRDSFGELRPGSTSQAYMTNGYGWGRMVEYFYIDEYGREIPYWVYEVHRNSYEEAEMGYG